MGKGLFERLADMAAGAAVVVIALQEIEVGGGSVAMAAAKDVLMKRQQVGLAHIDTYLNAAPCWF